jgi:CPA2 family monovalent cation:H+ antiporter-2
MVMVQPVLARRPEAAPLEAAFAELRALLGERFTTATPVREQHGRDESYHTPVAPDGVAFARSTEEVSAIVAICARHRLPVIPFGTGTSLEGHVGAIEGGITGLDFAILLGKIIILTAGAMLIGRFGFSRLEKFFERLVGSDIYIMLTVGIALTYGGLALLLGLSEVLGAFLAGIMLAETKRSHDIEHVTLPVRDLLLPIFFLHFGTTINLGEGVPYIGLLFTLIGWALVGKIIVGILGGRWYGLSKRVALRAGFSLTPRGEFSVVIAGIATGATKVFSGVFILVSAMLGILFFLLAPFLTNLVYGKKAKKKINLKVPS